MSRSEKGNAVIDFHSHVLPGIDDGSQSVEESLKMLAASAGQGITHMAATPHFDPLKTDPERFLYQRERAAEQLRAVWQPPFPRLLLGAEVCYFDGISQAAKVDALRIEGTSLLLLEMPFQPWPHRMVAEIKVLHNRPGCSVVLAHIERYLEFQKEEVWEDLLETGILMQCNASFFLRWSTRRKAVHMFDAGRIHVLGSDCHNMADRAPRMGEALAAIGRHRCEELELRAQAMLNLKDST